MDIQRYGLPGGLRSPKPVTLATLGIAAACLIVSIHDSSGTPAAADATPEPGASDSHCLTVISPAAESSAYRRATARYDVPETPLIRADGAETTAARVLDHAGPVMLNFIFTTCRTVCPVLSASFAQVNTLLGADADDILFVSITIDPEQDTPDTLRRYAQKYRAGDNWAFYTGHREDIVALQRAFDIYRGNKMSHRPVTFLRAHSGDPWLRLEGFPTAKDLAQEYRTLFRAASSAEVSG